MNLTNVEKNMVDTLKSFKINYNCEYENFAKAIEYYKRLEKRGLVRSRGNTLMPVEEKYRIRIEHNKKREMSI